MRKNFVFIISFFVSFSLASAQELTPVDGLTDWITDTLSQPDRTTNDVQGFARAINAVMENCHLEVQKDGRLKIAAVGQYAVDPREVVDVDSIQVYSSTGTNGALNAHYSITANDEDGEGLFMMSFSLFSENGGGFALSNAPISISMMSSGAGEIVMGLLPDPFGAYGFTCETIED